MDRFTSVANETLSFCWNLEVEVFPGWLKGFGRFPVSPLSRPPRTRLSPCGDDIRAGTLSVALRRLFLRPFHFIINSCICEPIHRDRFLPSMRRRGDSCNYIIAIGDAFRHFEAMCKLVANLHGMVQHVARSLLLSRINEDAPHATNWRQRYG